MLKRINRITKQEEFDAFFSWRFRKNRGQNASGKFLIVKTMKNDFGFPRFGFVVNNKIDNRSAVRNRIKRRLREIIRLNIAKIKPANDILIIVKPAIKEKKSVEIKAELGYLFDKLRLL